MCIRDRAKAEVLEGLGPRGVAVLNADDERLRRLGGAHPGRVVWVCLLYTSDAADERSSVDLGGRRSIKKKHTQARASREGRVIGDRGQHGTHKTTRTKNEQK